MTITKNGKIIYVTKLNDTESVMFVKHVHDIHRSVVKTSEIMEIISEL